MRNQSNKAWTDDELAILKKMYPSTPTIEIAEILRRPKQSIASIALKLKLTRNADFKKAKPGPQKIKRTIAAPVEEPLDETLELWKSTQKIRAQSRIFSRCARALSMIGLQPQSTRQAQII